MRCCRRGIGGNGWRRWRRADVVVLREEERERTEARVRALMRAGAAIWMVRRRVDFLRLPMDWGARRGW